MGRKTKIQKFQIHDFYCMKCGNRGISIQRPLARFREPFHRKKLWCPVCKCEVNHVECRNDEEAYLFRLDFEEGLYEEEAEASIEFLGEN